MSSIGTFGLLRQLHSRRRLRLFIGDESDQLNTGWCTPGVHAPEVTGGNRRQRNTAFTLTIVVHAGLSVVFLRFNSPLAHVSGWPRVFGSGALSISDRAAVRCARLQVFGCRRRFGVGPPQSPGVRRLSHLSHPSPAQRSLGGDFCSERQLPRLYRSRAASGPVARAKGRRLCMGATSVVTPLKTPRLPLHAPAVGLTPARSDTRAATRRKEVACWLARRRPRGGEWRRRLVGWSWLTGRTNGGTL